MFKVLDKKRLNPQVTYMKLAAPHVAGNAMPGQFIVIKVDETGERIPLTIADKDRKKETVSVIFQEIGTTTKKLLVMIFTVSVNFLMNSIYS